jgi:CubicO group peptidase (beta-lactamase class C family)
VPGHTVDISGRADAGFGAVKDAFAENFSQQGDVGASVAVMLQGEPVVDIWGGHQDVEQTVEWNSDTIINVWSTTKTMTNLAALVLASRGLLDVDAPVARYWPEFAAAGKQDVLVRQVLSHSAGQAGWDTPISVEDLFDWKKVTRMLAEQPTWWTPGTKSGYHAITQGNLIGELVRRIDGRTVGHFFAEEIAGPLGADFHIALGSEHDERVARVIPGPPLVYLDAEGRPARPGTIPYRTANPVLTAEDSMTTAWRRAEIPAASGHGNARSVACVQSVVSAGGSARGVTLLSKEILNRIFDVQAAGRDLVLGVGVTFGIGYGLNSPRRPIAPNPRVCYWGGWGGSLVVNDVDAGMTMAYVMNRMGEGTVGDDRAHTVLRAVYQSLNG